MQNAVSGDLFSRSLRLFFSNAIIAVPLITAFVAVQAFRILFHPSTPDANVFIQILGCFIGAFAFSSAYACTIGMIQTAWAHGKTTFSDGWKAASESLDHVVIAAIALQLIYTVPSVLVKQSFAGQNFISGILSSVSIILLVLSLSLVLSYLVIYMGPSIVIGKKNAYTGFLESAKIASQNIGTTFTITLITYGVFAIGFAFLFSSNFFASQLVSFLLFICIFSPAVCFINFLVCGKYLSVCGFPSSSIWGMPKKKKSSTILLAVAYIAGFSALTIFSANGFSFKTYSPSVDFSSKTGNISVKHLLQNFIIETRSIKTDRAVEKHAIDDAYGMIVPHSDAYAYLEAWYPTHDPFALSHKEAKFVYELKIKQSDQIHVYDITWHEAILNPSTNAIKHSDKWEATVRVTPNANPQEPFITQIFWKKM